MPELQHNAAAEKGRSLVISSVLVYTLANILTKVIGVFFKIPMLSLLGDTGMGYFNAAYQVYVWFYMISTAGLPVAVSTLVAESRAKGRFRQVHKVYRIALRLFFVIGLTGALLMFALSRPLASLVDPAARFCIIALAPTLFFVCLSSAFRGYFQGFRYMVPTGISEVIEALGKLLVGILFARLAIAAGKPIEVVAACAVLGVTVGVIVGFFYLWLTKLSFSPARYDVEYRSIYGKGVPDCAGTKPILSRLLKVAIPITLSSSAMSLAGMIDTMVLTSGLTRAGFEKEAAVSMYGTYSTQITSLFNLPPVLIYPVAYVIVPLVAECVARRDRNRMRGILSSAFKMTAIIALPCALGMAAIPRYILNTVYNHGDADVLAPLLSIIAVAVFFVGILATTNSALQGARKERYPIISMLAGAAVKLISSWILVGIPAVNIYGAPISTLLCYITAASFNLYFVFKKIGYLPSVTRVFLRPFIAAAAAGGSAYAVSRLAEKALFPLQAAGRGQNALITLLSVFIAVPVYVIILFKAKGVTEEDLALLPKSKKIVAVLKKVRLL
ncbi:MAG: polysaccharide biosynthesis protein [Clostridia bacterium]|nr:polysaccharide biosynthesis protein [Clostridia bacterium]